MIDGSVRCRGYGSSGQGYGSDGQLGDGTGQDFLPANPQSAVVRGLNNALSVAAGGSHVCAVRSDKSVVCWGDNSSGQLGNGNAQMAWQPVTVKMPALP
jgi:alpha-tubulin suppressor-like RCC1 family protein